MGGPCIVDGQSRQELDNFYTCSFEVQGQSWQSSEHCYQASKFPDNPDVRESIRKAASGMDSWKQGQGGAAAKLRDDWEEVKVECMYKANFAKFLQNDYLQEFLISTSGPITAQGGLFWKTWNEILLERIREELREPNERNRQVLNDRVAMMDAIREAGKSKDQRLIQAVTVNAAQRQLPPSKDELANSAVSITSAGKSLSWLKSSKFEPDMLEMEYNGEQHYINSDGLHLYLGSKRGRKAWVIDEVASPNEVCGTAYIEVTDEDLALPMGEREWLCFDETQCRHEPAALCISV